MFWLLSVNGLLPLPEFMKRTPKMNSRHHSHMIAQGDFYSTEYILCFIITFTKSIFDCWRKVEIKCHQVGQRTQSNSLENIILGGVVVSGSYYLLKWSRVPRAVVLTSLMLTFFKTLLHVVVTPILKIIFITT